MAKYYTRVYMNTGYTSPEAFQDVCFNNKNLNRLCQPHKLNQYLKFDEETGSVWWAMGSLEGYQYISNSEMISKLSNFKPNNATKAQQPAIKAFFKYYPKTPHQRLLLTETVKQLHAAGVELVWNPTEGDETDGVCFHLDYTFRTGVGVGWALEGSFYDVDTSVVELSFKDMMAALVKLMPEPPKPPTSIKFWEKDSFGRKLVGVVTKAGASFQFPVVDNCHAFDLTNDMIDALIEARNKLK